MWPLGTWDGPQSNLFPTLITVGADIVALIMSGDTDDEVITEEVFTKHHVSQATDQYFDYVPFPVAVITPKIVGEVPITTTWQWRCAGPPLNPSVHHADTIINALAVLLQGACVCLASMCKINTLATFS